MKECIKRLEKLLEAGRLYCFTCGRAPYCPGPCPVVLDYVNRQTGAPDPERQADDEEG
jgi:hypothetical protein